MLKLLSSGLIVLVLTTGLSIDTLVQAPSIAKAEQSQPSWWEAILRSVRRRPPVSRRSGGGRGDFDAIAPGIWTPQVLTTQPMVIWRHRGSISRLPDRIEIVPVGQKTIVWKQSLPATSFFAAKVGVALQSGQTYRLRFLKEEKETRKSIEFRVLSDSERQPILQVLNQTETALRSQQATPKEILTKRIEILSNYGLWSDALQEINSSELPALERQQLTQAIVDQWYQARQKKQPEHPESH
ncbi:hypothetical protein [Leptolyngbya sp. GGD]|uniref:hypothetical protein n=1 Tax=Leptolyngbya sp. GGD TaxID=2997907 RepID=UPI00227AABDF|nr:hypothetical protein [Leptolyngbya sp. GGD]MCY6493855.1 hypothetical protein [Leptolyngbya sp. GGD]